MIANPRTRTRDRTKPIPGVATPGDSLIQRPPPVASADVMRRVGRMLLLRTLVITVVMGLSVWLLSIADQPPRAVLYVQSALIAMTYLTSVVFGVLLRRRRLDPLAIARAMQASDLAVTSLFVLISGGAQSPYVFLYAFSIVGAGVLFYRRGAVVVSLVAIGALVLVSVLAWLDTIPIEMPAQVHPWDLAWTELARTLGIDFAALVGVGALAYIFGDQLERQVETLATTRRAAADLLSLHQDIVRSLSSGLVTISPDGTILTMNQSASDILRVLAVDATARPIDTVMPGFSALLAEPGERRRADLVIPGVPELVIGVTVSLLRDVHDQVLGRVINFQDLTELRRLEAHIHRAERLATVGQLAAGVAHEIRNPLASISGSIELLRATPQASEDDRALMAIVHREIQRLNHLIGDLLDYANPRSKLAIDFDVGELVAEVLQVAAGDKAFAEVDVTNELERPCRMHGDPAKIRQVVWNLLRNAGDAAMAGGKHVRVEVFAADAVATIAIGDDGPGIPADQVSRIFDPFFTTKRTGTGLGLATCHAIVAEHGGRIDVETDATGTQLLVRLPTTAPEA